MNAEAKYLQRIALLLEHREIHRRLGDLSQYTSRDATPESELREEEALKLRAERIRRELWLP